MADDYEVHSCPMCYTELVQHGGDWYCSECDISHDTEFELVPEKESFIV